MNPFQDTFINRLSSWRDLRHKISLLASEERYQKLDEWWQQAPLINHHLHPMDIENWPNPWELLSDNQYCYLTRAVGICYTLIMNDIECEIIIAKDRQAEELPLVLVDKPKYILNYWPNTVLSNKLSDFSIQRSISTTVLKTKIK